MTVNSVLPGPTETENLKALIKSVNPDSSYNEAERKSMAERKPSSLIYRLAKAAEVADVVALLASDRAAAPIDWPDYARQFFFPYWRPAVTPPSTGSTVPVIHEAWSEAKNKIASATSAG